MLRTSRHLGLLRAMHQKKHYIGNDKALIASTPLYVGTAPRDRILV
jgi:hypothetical protein